MQSNPLREILRILFHGMPLVPLLIDEAQFAVVALVVVLLTYIKAKKFDSQVRYLQERSHHAALAVGAIEETLQMRSRWSYLTYLNWPV